jgi:hypothetical protein
MHGGTAEAERHNHNNCFENAAEVEIAVYLEYSKVVPVS